MRWRFLVCPLLVVLTGMVFWQACTFEFVNFDDEKYVATNPLLENGLTAANCKWAFTTTYFSNWHPLVWLSYLLDAELFGISATAFHSTNIVIHVANVVLLFSFLRQSTDAHLPCMFVAAVFAIHPLHVEPVVWISSRKDVLSTFFGLLALIAYSRYVRLAGWSWLCASLAAFACSLMSKQMLVTLPFVLLLLDYWPFQRARRLRRLVLEKLPFLALSAVLSVVAFVSQSRAGSTELLDEISVSSRCLNAILVYGLYLGKTIWPTNLAVFYPHPGPLLSLWAVAAAAILLVAVTVVAAYRARRYPYFAVGWFWYLGSLVPVIGIVQVGRQQMADRYMYFPMIGLLIAVAWLVPELLAQRGWHRRALTFLSISSVTALAVSAWNQTRHWENSISLFEHAVRITRNNDLAFNNLGLAEKAAGRNSQAGVHFREALRINPRNAQAHNNLGNLLQETNQLAAAIPHLRKAVELNGNFADAHNNLGNALKDLKRFDESIASLERAIKIDPANATYYSNAGVALYERGQLQQASDYFQTALRLDPQYVFARINLGVAKYRQGRYEDAIRQFRHVRRLQPTNDHARRLLAQTHFAIARRHEQQGQREAAIRNLRHAIRIDPDHTDAKVHLRRALEAN